jgi:hypothetical protein
MAANTDVIVFAWTFTKNSLQNMFAVKNLEKAEGNGNSKFSTLLLCLSLVLILFRLLKKR